MRTVVITELRPGDVLTGYEDPWEGAVVRHAAVEVPGGYGVRMTNGHMLVMDSSVSKVTIQP